MSGQQIGSFVGAVVGSFIPVVGTALGAAIGGMIGGWISPTQVNGPRPGDGAAQSSADGQPIAWIQGTAGWVQGNISQKSERRIVKKTDDGKGSGTEVNTFEAHQDFLILICESSETRGSLMKGVLMVRVDGKVVYDMRPESNFGAENAKFLRNHTFYDGNEDQLPDPTMEAAVGVDRALAYRGVFTMVARDINLAPYGDRIPTYEFVMVGEGEVVTTTTTSYAGPRYGRFLNGTDWPLADSEAFYTFRGYREMADGTPVTYEGDSIADVLAHFSTGYFSAPNIYLGWTAFPSNGMPTNVPAGLRLNRIDTPTDVGLAVSVQLVYSEFTPSELVNVGADSAACPIIPVGGGEWYCDWSGNLLQNFPDGVTPAGLAGFQSCTSPDSVIWGIKPLYIQADRRAFPGAAVAGDPCLLGIPVILPDEPNSSIDCAGVITPSVDFVATPGEYKALAAEGTYVTLIGGVSYVQFSDLTTAPILPDGDPQDTEAFWTAAYDAAVIAGTMAPGLVYETDYPQLLDEAFVGTSVVSTLQTDTLSVGTALTRIALRSGLTVDDIDVSEMTDQLLGYPILQAYNGADCMRPLMTAFTSFGSEYDGKIRFHKHGAATDIVVNPDDFIEGSDDIEEDTRNQPVEYPRLFSVRSIDPTQDYTVRPQTERRLSPDVRALGESTIDLSVVLHPTYQRELAAIGMKVQWARQQGEVKFSVPFATATETYLKMVPGATFSLYNKRFVSDRILLKDGEIEVHGKYDRQSAYTADVTPTPALPPTAPPSSIGGVTLFAAMNLPRLRSQDNSPGMYVTFAGLLAGWPGAFLQLSTDDGASWRTVITSATVASAIGYLRAPIGTLPSDTLAVAVHGSTLNSISDSAFSEGGNPVAVLTAGVAEIMQFLEADEIAPDDYDLTGLGRGRLGTTPASHAHGDRFTSLSGVYFVPLDISLAGREIWFRPVTFNTAPDANAIYPVTFLPQFTGPQVIEAYLNESGDPYTDQSGSTYYRTSP